MSEDALYINSEQPAEDELDSDFRVLVLQDKPGDGEPGEDGTTHIEVDQSEVRGRLLEGIHTFSGINAFFDAFDEEIAYPNEGQIKYDVGSDGFILIVVKGEELKEKVLEFIQGYLEKVNGKKGDTGDEKEAVEEEEDEPSKKRKKN